MIWGTLSYYPSRSADKSGALTVHLREATALSAPLLRSLHDEPGLSL